MELVVNDLGAVRSNIDSEFDTICNQAMRMAERMNVTPSTPRMAQRQMHRDNIEAANPKEYYKLSHSNSNIRHFNFGNEISF